MHGIKLGIGICTLICALSGKALGGDLNVEGNLNVKGSLSVSGAVTGVVMPAPAQAAPNDAATRLYVDQKILESAALTHTHQVLTNDLAVLGRVGIGTSTPLSALHVLGETRLEGPVWIAPQSDLSMGTYTNSP
ncbi:MAG TPA: hypothetical protein DCZ95_01445 [Verrucomicrobia bacterium]|nr:MAG: hypothetical protein A2X46_08835 [Lentisphaerae bacterium GWF2_57_35]HBA82733.1 hypothetical protein [Verrucomicrobiota bacterium]